MNKNLQGKSDELHSPTPLQKDSARDDNEDKSDFWKITREFIYRHHVEPRVKLYIPKKNHFLFQRSTSTWFGGRFTRKQTTSRLDDVWPDMWKFMPDGTKQNQTNGPSRNQSSTMPDN